VGGADRAALGILGQSQTLIVISAGLGSLLNVLDQALVRPCRQISRNWLLVCTASSARRSDSCA